MAMTKGQFIRSMQEQVEISKADLQSIFDAMNTVITKNLAKVGRIPLGGLGSIILSDRKARIGRNPQTGEAIKIKAKRVVKIRIAKALKEAFNKVAK